LGDCWKRLNLKKKLVKCYIWSTALYGAETWTLRKVDQKYLERFAMWCWRRMEKISWTDRVRNEVLLGVEEERNILHTAYELPSKIHYRRTGRRNDGSDGKTMKKK
jgi:hypothetical protein